MQSSKEEVEQGMKNMLELMEKQTVEESKKSLERKRDYIRGRKKKCRKN